MYEELIGKPSDTTEFRYSEDDTLVSVPLDFDPFERRGLVKVPYEAKDSTFLRLYKKVVYNLGETGSSKERMHYWKDDVRIYIDESVPDEHAKELMDFAENLASDIDSLNISRQYSREKANYLVYYLNRDHLTDYEPRINAAGNGYYINWNGKQQIYNGKLKINTELVKSEFDQIQLLKSNFFKSLGFFKSSRQLQCGSFLSPCPGAKKLTAKDMEILKYHYSYGVCKGVDLKTFTEVTNSMNQKLKEDPNAILYIAHHE